MANTFELIASSTVGLLGASDITFSSIPSTYTDLSIKFSARSTDLAAKVNGLISFNGSTSNFTVRYLGADGSTPYTNSGAFRFCSFINGAGSTANTFASNDIYIPNYAGSTNKSFSVDGVTENNATSTEMWMIAGLWSNTSAISSISITPSAGTLMQYTTAYLYGVKNA
jgi:hypothetical protein